MKRWIAKLLANKRGAFAMQFALMIVPMVAATGLAVDGGRSFLARFELGSALDAAALAAGSNASTDSTVLTAFAQKYVDKNFHSAPAGSVTVTLTQQTDGLTLHGAVDIDTYFMPLVGINKVSIAADSQVKRGGANIEVALILDTTGSMSSVISGDSQTKIAELRTAATTLVNTVVSDTQPPNTTYYSRLALVSYSMGVNTGTYANNLRGPLTQATTITGATWKNGAAKTATNIGWRNGAAKTISSPGGGASNPTTSTTWQNGAAVTVSKVTKGNPATLTLSSVTGLANGNTVYLSNLSSIASLNNKMFVVSGLNTTNKTVTVPVNIASNSTGLTGSSQKCFDATCDIQVYAASHGFSNGDLIWITGVSGLTSINLTTGTWTISGVTTNTFLLNGSTGPGSSSYSSGGTASKCFDAACDVQVQLNNHGYANNDSIYISGASFSSANSPTSPSAPTPWTVTGVTTNYFYLGGTSDVHASGGGAAGGTLQKCFTNACEVQVTSNAHGLSNNDYVLISGVAGMTSLNNGSNSAWQVESAATNTFVLSNSTGPNYSDYSSGGTAQCLRVGCQSYRFLNPSGSVRVYQASNCVTERTGADAYDDVAPSTSYLGMNYPVSTNPCPANTIIPLTATKSTVNTAISGLSAGGSTGGQVGMAWGWYMVSPNFSYLWPNAENKPAAYGSAHTVKVAVLMTDGEFNSPYCNGVIAADATSGSGNTSDHINCNATNGDSYSQAESMCAAMKAQGITLYTVGFDVSSDTNAQNLMTSCATDASHAFIANSGADLQADFAQIAKSISMLRLSQ